MTEKEYIDVSNLAHIRDAERALHLMTVDDKTIKEKEFLEMFRTLSKWRNELTEKLMVEE